MSLTVRRALFAGSTLAVALLFAVLVVAVMGTRDRTFLDWLLAALFVIVMAWEGMVASQASLGFAAFLAGRPGWSPLERRAEEVEPVATGRSRTAIVVPIYDEDVAAVFAAVSVMGRSLAALGPTDDLAFHVLSDSVDAATIAAETRAAARLRDAPGLPPVHYRHRTDNSGRKAGNIAEFLDRTAGEYDLMVVLDADSLMSGATIRKLIRIMEENPGVALVQTISFAANRRTLFARTQQFAVRLYARLSLRGMTVWQGADGLYYGHNAIVRCAPFREHARLPVLPGRPPLGGEILCHDVVEAALLRRAGWEVRVLPDLDGTWEEMPTNIVDLLGRERRWCQGNLQHLGILPMPGLTGGSRTHILTGIVGYLVGPVWWAFVALGAIRVLTAGSGDNVGVLAYGLTETGPAASWLVWVSVVCILLPRVLNVLRALLDRPERAGFGGARRLMASVVAEQAFSCLLTPLLSLVTIRFTIATFLGKVATWDSQSRADRDVGWAEAMRVVWSNVVVGVGLAVAAAIGGGWYAAWMVPTIAGLIGGPAVIVWSSRLSVGEAAARLGLFATVDETDPAPELVAYRSLTEPAALRPILEEEHA